jgi:hypothetical protein
MLGDIEMEDLATTVFDDEETIQNSFYEIALCVKHFFRIYIAFPLSLGGAALPSSGMLEAYYPQQ